AKSLTYHEDNSGQFVGGMEIGGITLYDLTVNDNSADNDDNAVGYDLYNNAQIANRILISDHVVVNNNLYIGQGSALFPANNLPASSTVDVNLTMDGATGKIYNYGRLDCTPEVTQSSGDWDKRRLNFIFDGTTTIMPSTIFKDRFRFSNITINSSAELLADAGGTAGIEMQYGNLNNNGTLNLSASNSGNISFGLRGENVHANIYTLESSLATGTFIFHDVLIGRWESTLKPKTDGGSMFLQVKGDFENYSIFQAEDGAGLFSLTMNGTSRQEIVGNVNETVNDQTVFRSLSIDNDNGNGDDNAGGDVHFVSYGGGQIDYYVTNVFSLIKGDIVTRDRTDPNISHNLYFDDGCFVAGAGAQSYDGTNTSSFIDGPVSFILLNRPAITLEYFIGKAGSYRKALFTCFNASTTDPIIYTAELFNASAYDLNNTIPSSPELIQNISLVHYWRVETNAPNYFNSGSIWLDYDQNWAHDGVSDPDNLRILKAPTGGNGAWENISVGSGGFGTGSGFIASDTFYSLSDFTLANLGSNPLPVEFLDFSVKRQSDIAQINWSTASEINNEFFKIMRSGNAENFEEIDRVPGQGTTNQISHYERYDLNPLPGWNYYKIIQVDYDGSSEETQMEAVYFDDEAELILYPNPANELIYFSFIAAEIDYFIYDSKGALLVSRSLRSQDGQHVISIQELESGAYFLEVHSQNGQVYRQKFLKF
ncbi:MAG: T9SS type A sorting domain-containing protein, partial [Bacteroidota bacterium]